MACFEAWPAARCAGEWREGMTAQVPRKEAPEGLSAGVMVELANGMTAKVHMLLNHPQTIHCVPLAVHEVDHMQALMCAGSICSIQPVEY